MIFAYVRVSTLDQSGPNKTSIYEQTNKCRTVAQLRGSVTKYDFQVCSDAGVSGSVPLEQRPAGKDMLAQLKKGDIVIAAKMDRLFRSGVDALSTIERFKKQKLGLILCDMGIEPVCDSPASTMFFNMLASFAQFERERICERIREGKLAKRGRGGHIGGPVPLGYRKIGKGPTSILVKNDIEAEHIAAARYHYRQMKRGPTHISRLLANEGMLGRDGKPYHRVLVWRMIHETRTMYDHVPGQPDQLPMENVFDG